MSVEIDPTELSFRRPFTSEVQQVLKIKNPNSSPVAFKVKTTAPKQYCVRPNSGRIEPGHDVEVAVLLQAMKADPPNDAKCRDKFLVQSIIITPDQEFSGSATVLESADKSSIQEKKIRVIWLPAGLSAGDSEVPSAATPLRQTLGSETHDGTPDVSRAFASPSATNDDALSNHNAPPPYSDDAKAQRPVSEEPSKPLERQPRSPVPSSRQPTYNELQAKLADAEAVIESLRKEPQLRKRKGGAETEKAGALGQLATATRQDPEGVPVKVVAILCFFTFLLSYIFF